MNLVIEFDSNHLSREVRYWMSVAFAVWLTKDFSYDFVRCVSLHTNRSSRIKVLKNWCFQKDVTHAFEDDVGLRDQEVIWSSSGDEVIMFIISNSSSFWSFSLENITIACWRTMSNVIEVDRKSLKYVQSSRHRDCEVQIFSLHLKHAQSWEDLCRLYRSAVSTWHRTLSDRLKIESRFQSRWATKS